MTDNVALERWYRRLLSWYPAEHRRTYGDEMIGVLLASAPEGRHHPGVADLIDLIRGGLRARLHPAGGGSLDVGWRDSLAVFSIVAPAMALGYFVITNAVNWVYLLPDDTLAEARRVIGGAGLGGLVIFLAMGLPALLALRGLRRTAILAASMPAAILTGFTIWRFATVPVTSYLFTGFDAYWLCSVLAVIALAISPGPRRGAAIMSARAWYIAGIGTGLAGLAVSLPEYVLEWPASSDLKSFGLAASIVAAAIGLVVVLPARVGPRLLLLLAIPGYAAAVESWAHGGLPFGNAVYQSGLELVYLPTLALICVVGALAWRSGRGRADVDHDRAA